MGEGKRGSAGETPALPGDANMEYNKISVWWDGKSTVKVDADGNVLGFQIFGVSKRARRKPFGFELTPQSEPPPAAIVREAPHG